MGGPRFYIPNLNGLRFLAAFGVILSHIELTKRDLGYEHLIDSDVLFFKNGMAHIGVVLFFVLSGFLISSLLIKEKSKFHTINVKNFIIRRALRIWPVYFLFITIVIFFFVGFEEILVNDSNSVAVIACYYLMLPNVAMCGLGSIKYIAHLWSIGVEEQFYLLWPFVFKYLRKKLIILVMLALIMGIPLIPHAADYLALRITLYAEVFQFIRTFFEYFLINSMAIGGLAAYFFHKYENKLKAVITTPISYASLLLCIIPWGLGFHFNYLNNSFYSVLFGMLILVLSASQTVFVLENKMVNYLGKISYGLYVYHWLIAFLVIDFMHDNFGTVPYFISTLSVLIVTILVSAISYELMEKPILRFKSKFTLIQSGKL